MSIDKQQKAYHNVFFARQPIFNNKMKVWGYELFYRKNEEADSATYIDEFKATMEVMSNLALSPDDKFKAAKIIINFSEQAVLEDLPLSLHPKSTIVQFTDPEKVSSELIETMHKLKDSGYTISLDDYAARYENQELYALVDISG
ncbi:hypothetical protein [Maridesulfovibrio ferrireducens]|uniref:hypothetical protein n=1 Tax=Maridesulfovibrio ferrireducens TaxID=246191 RepID=UPI001A22DEAB|nr:hypothetical protein [Maridesulfovibrio ferrireducens]MBI9110671.1 hypothetical protein [Maridesulfovibrio ferrireducens]